MNHSAFFLAAILSATALYGQGQFVSSPAAAVDISVRRFEIGGRLTDLTLGSPGQINVPKFAIGPEITFNLNHYLALDASYLVMNPQSCLDTTCSYGRESVFVAGVRAEARARHYGLFAYGRPGLIHLPSSARSISYISPTGPATISFNSPASMNFASAVGGGVEYFASSRFHAKVELGDLLEYAPCVNCVQNWTNHLQFSIGADAMIGKPLAAESSDIGSKRSHRFGDKWNLLLLGISVLGQSADADTTQRFIRRGVTEADPLARPLVSQGWPGQIGAGVIENGMQILVMFQLHKMGHHRIERLVPLASGFVGGYMGYRNLQHQ